MKAPLLLPFAMADKYQLAKSYEIEFNYHGDILTVKCPAGWLFNGASIPRAFWTTTGTPYTPKYAIPAIVHDRLYETGEYSRKQVDKIFLYLLKANGVNWYTRRKMYLGVRAGGWVAWNRCRKKKR